MGAKSNKLCIFAGSYNENNLLNFDIMKRTLNIIERAIEDFGLEVDMNYSMQDVLDQAMNAIEDAVEYDYISECERSRHWDHISWSDGNGFNLEADGEFISGNERSNKYYRYENGEYHQIPWYEHTADDYVAVYDVLDTYGKRALLVAK